MSRSPECGPSRRLLEQFEEVRGRSFGEHFGILSPQLSYEACGIGDEGRLALLSAVRHWREERRIRLDQHLVSGQPFGRCLQVLSVLERHDARKRDVESELEALACELGRSREAVEDADHATFPHSSVENFSRVLLGIARVDHEREARLTRGFDMCLEAFALCRTVGLVVIIVETALPNRDYARVIRGLNQRRRAEVWMRVSFMRMDPDAGPDVRLTFGNADDVVPFALARRDIEEASDAAF